MKFDFYRDVLSLMMGKLGLPGADNFGRESNQRRSLLLDTVMQGRPRVSSCKLLQLPAEILADIVDLLSDDRASLESLALVNSDFSKQSSLLPSLWRTNRLSCPNPGLALVFAELLLHLIRTMSHTHRELYESFYGDDAQSVAVEQRQVLSDEAREEYVVARAAAVEAISSLPNLETLSWRDQFSLDKSFFERITRCSAQHIDLNRPAIDDAWSLTPPLTPSTWPLRSLKLDVSMALDKRNEIEKKGATRTHHMTSFFSTLFHLCSPTLESLTWTYIDLARDGGVPVSIGESVVSFPRLRYLRLQFVKLDSVAISSFLAAPLKSLDLDDRVLNNPSTFDYKPLRDLEDFAVSHPPKKASACKRIAKFISQHTGLRRLYLHESSSAQGGTAYLDDVILPTLSSLDFGNLRSLYLAWREVQIPEKSLRRIGRLVSLEQLSLSAGKPSGWQHQWLVDHDELRQHLRQLQGLTKLALVRDTCLVPVPYPGLPSETYYKMRFAGSEEREDAEARPDLDMDQDTESDAQEGEGLLGDMEETWERAHRNRMLDQAEKYAAVFPKLEWMFCGQGPMGFMKTPEGQCEFRRAVPLTQGRDECRTYRRAIFRGSN
ncbi:hypothetical protein BFJ63_vAg3636 [Fusarium oxysporum f. sp. narcissi]|uniref:Uncharacterized protein n=1 Tax=Fusarium oxysporum f. sp. narcissi TaxID=451672 RepID=A0A4Q2W266_FUSOX|nr:hypothetical protein BFJ63_vAg3636 [Fusarium oxysporum f. sp. narcissi]